ncbi:MAG: DUF2259 domain-containing protein [Methylococcales bacterium]
MLFSKRILFLASLIIGFCIITTSRAGDLAELQVIGFSPNGEYFAFEQYGIQDGSGFPYSDIFIINTASDTWIPGTPIRVVINDESSSLSAARDISAQRATPLLSQFNISQPAHPLLNHLVKQDDNSTGQFNIKIEKTKSTNTSESREYFLNLKQWEIKEARCQDYGMVPKLFRLSISPANQNQSSTRILHEDSALPRSRGCPLEYGIHSVLISSQDKQKTKAIAVILNVFLMGYEGRNQRFLAITSQLD